MIDRPPEAPNWLRAILMFSGPMNVVGAISFAPPFTAARAGIGLPDGPPIYLWLISAWILAFGVAYFWQGWTGQIDRTFLAVGAFGKASFAALLIGNAATGELPTLATAGAIPDLALAGLFTVWLIRTSASVHGRVPIE